MRKKVLLSILLLLSLAPSLGSQPVFRRARRAASAPSQACIPREGEVHIPVLLVEFSDVRMSLPSPKEHFSSMFNKEGYTEAGATGSVHDYFHENSGGRFCPVFDIYGPVQLDKKMAAYGKDILQNGSRKDDIAPELALVDACLLLDQQIDFSAYDANQDGLADLCIFYFAGYDQAEGGPSDAIWSHHWDVQDSDLQEVRDLLFDGVKLGAYFCSAELSGKEGTRPMGIGASCHELAHSLGLPDFYDVNDSQDGYAGGVYDFSLMGNGLYNNDGRTPPYLNAMERMLLGWMPEIPELPLGEGVLLPVQQMQAFRIPTATEGEYFLIEARDGRGWDAPLPEGMVVYHVDQSQRLVGNVPASTLWLEWRSYNSLNNLGSHPCFYLVPSSHPGSLNDASAFNPSSLVFPGAGLQHAYEPIDWEGRYTGYQLSCLEFDFGQARYRLVKDGGAQVDGLVRNSAGKPISGVQVQLEGNGQVTLTDEKGYFLLPLEGEGPFILNLQKNGYQDFSIPFSLKDGSRTSCQLVTLHTPGEADNQLLQKYDPEKTPGYFPESAIIGAVHYPSHEIRHLAGRQLTEIVCYPYIYARDEQMGNLYITVDFGPVRVLNKKVENPQLGEFRRIAVDLKEEDLRIPEGIDIYIGYGFDQAPGNYPISVVYPGTKGNCYWSPFSLEQSDWQELYSASAGQYMDIMLSANAGEVPTQSLSQMGYVSIDPGKGTYRSGDLFQAALSVPKHVKVRDVQWGWDGLRLENTTFRLNRGDHLLEALVSYEDGRREKLQLTIKVRE